MALHVGSTWARQTKRLGLQRQWNGRSCEGTSALHEAPGYLAQGDAHVELHSHRPQTVARQYPQRQAMILPSDTSATSALPGCTPPV